MEKQRRKGGVLAKYSGAKFVYKQFAPAAGTNGTQLVISNRLAQVQRISVAE